MNSRIIPATVAHTRLAPKKHAFEYTYLCLLLDLNELKELDNRLRLFGLNRAAAVSIIESDYLTPGPESIRAKLNAFLNANQRDPLPPGSRVLLLTAARVFGKVFNPVSIYFCFNPHDELELCVAEVNNTFGDKHIYLLDRATGASEFPVTYRAPKAFHVSPFFDMHGEYLFRFGDIRQELNLGISLLKQDQPVLEATLTQRAPARELTDRALLTAWARHPLAPNLTYPRILRQALALYLGKGLNVFSRPEPSSPMTIRTMPVHASRLDRPGRGLERHLARRLALRLARLLVFWNFEKIHAGTLRIHLPDGSRHVFGGHAPGPECDMHVTDHRLFWNLLKGEDVALGEGYTQGLWTTDDLPRLMELLIMNMGRMAYLENLGRIGSFVHRCMVLAKKAIPANCHTGSKVNIRAHYDLSNEFFRLFLDPGMTYSCAVFDDIPAGLRSSAPASDKNLDQEMDRELDLQLEKAQERKFRMIAESLDLRLGAKILEIGSGWGGFACFLAEHFSCKVQTVTISRQQYEYVRKRIRQRGLQGRVTVLLEDYRNLHGRFDALVSIEMLEAVGHAYHPRFFQAVDRLLKPGGKACIQTITILDQRYDTYRRTQDWISTHIFPGGLLPSLTRISQILSRHTSLVVAGVRDIGPHYALTLRAWRQRFLANRERIAALGFDQTFCRTWEYYFAMCEAAFAQRHIRDLQIVLDRPAYHQ
jgi:cyclopropane-fatty-acyl-phospholipid synthase